jgi:hypothetical protein
MVTLPSTGPLTRYELGWYQNWRKKEAEKQRKNRAARGTAASMPGSEGILVAAASMPGSEGILVDMVVEGERELVGMISTTPTGVRRELVFDDAARIAQEREWAELVANSQRNLERWQADRERESTRQQEERERQLARQQEAREKILQRLQEEREKNLARLKDESERNLARLQAEHDRRMAMLQAEHKRKREQVEADHKRKLARTS